MAVTIREYMEKPDIFEKSASAIAERCSNPECNRILSGTVTGREKGPNGSVCSDCYYDALGDLVESHPIGRATPHGCR